MRSRVRIPNVISGSLRIRIIAWSFVPTAIILLAVALVNFYAYQRVTKELVIERDRDLVRLSASEFVNGLTKYTDLLTALARKADVYQGDEAAQRDALKGATNRLAVFDGGVLIFDANGTVIAAEPARPEILGQHWNDRAYYVEFLQAQIHGSISASSRPIFSDIVADGPDGADVIVAILPITAEHGEFVGAMVGMFRVGATSVSAFYGDIVKLCNAKSGSVYLVDGSGRAIYHSDTDRIGEDLSAQAVTQQVLDEQADAIRTRNLQGKKIVASFAPVPGTSWGLVTEERWGALTSSFQDNQNFLLILLVLGLVIPAIVVSVGVGRITRPITSLIKAAQEVSRGNFGQTITARTGDEIGELSRQFNLMSAQLQASYTNLEQRVAGRTKELAALNDIATVVSHSLDLDETLHAALDKTLQVMDIEAGGIYLLDKAGETLSVAAQRGFSPGFVAAIDKLGLGEGFSGSVAQSGQPMVVKDMASDPRLTRMAARTEGLRSQAIVPLKSKGKILGTLFAVTRSQHEFSAQDVQLLASIGHQVGVAIENARLFETEQRRAEEFRAISEVGRHITSIMAVDELLGQIAHLLKETLGYYIVGIGLIREDELIFRAGTGAVWEDPDFQPPRLKVGQEGITGWVAQSGEPLLVSDVSQESRFWTLPQASEIRSELAVPLKTQERIIGVLHVQSDRLNAFDENDLAVLQSLANQATVAIQNARLFRDTARQVRELHALADASRIISSKLDQDQLLQALYEQVTRIAPTDFYVIALYDQATNVVSIEISVDEGVCYPKDCYVLDKGLLKRIIHERRPLRFDSLAEEQTQLDIEIVSTGSPKVNQGWLGVPMLCGDKVMGAIIVGSYQRGVFDEGHQRTLSSVANQAAVALDNARLYEQTQQELAERKRVEEKLRRLNAERARRIRELALLNRVIAATTSRLEIKAVLEAVCRELTLFFNVPSAAAALLDEARASLTVVAEHRSEERPSALDANIPVQDNPATQYVLEHKAPLAVADAQHDPRLAPVHHLMRERGVVSLLLLPLIARDEVVGTIGMDAVERRDYSDEEIALAAYVAAAASQALENARAEEALRESEQTLKLAMEGANVGFWHQDMADGARTMIIQDRTQDLGYVEMDAQAGSQVTHPDDIAKVAEAWEAYIAGKTPIFEVEYRNRMGADEWRWILVRGQVVVRDEHGEPARMAGIFQDVTARVQAESQRDATLEALRRSQQRLSAHVQHTPLAYIEWDADLRVLHWNPSAERIFGYSETEAQNSHAYEIIVHPEVRPHVAEIWQSLLKQTGGTRSTNENVTKDGRTIVCEWYNTPLIDDGNVIGLASLVQDITHRVQTEENLREAKVAAEKARAAAETANRAKSAFLANMSHELRTPLNAILGFSQLMLRETHTGDPGLSAEQQENLEIIGRSGEHLLGLINDVLELSKIEAGRVALQERNFDLHRLLAGLEEMFYLRATNKGLTLIFDRAPDVPQYIRADEGKLRQVLMNLLGNAVKFTREGGVTLRVGCWNLPGSFKHEKSAHEIGESFREGSQKSPNG